jgi:DNA-binding NtrC family response regulator
MTRIPLPTLYMLAEAMTKLEQEIAFAARSDVRILVSGDSGAGKKFVAQLIHQRSQRADGPFVVLNGDEFVAGPGNESMAAPRLGERLIQATNGTLFIQEVERIPAHVQKELVRAVEIATGRNVRIITTTSCDLFELVQADQFSSDLFYRLNLIHLMLPSVQSARPGVRSYGEPAGTDLGAASRP